MPPLILRSRNLPCALQRVWEVYGPCGSRYEGDCDDSEASLWLEDNEEGQELREHYADEIAEMLQLPDGSGPYSEEHLDHYFCKVWPWASHRVCVSACT